MTFDFRKIIPTQFKKIKIPDTFNNPLIHNPEVFEEMKQKLKDGKITQSHFERWYQDHVERDHDIEERWRRLNIQQELKEKNIKDFQSFKENPRAFAKKMYDMGKLITKNWFTRPNQSVGSGKMIQNKLTGEWQQEYKPKKSLKLKDWINAAEQGEVMLHMNPNRIKLNRQPTPDELKISEESKRKRGQLVWNWILEQTKNFGRGWKTDNYGKTYTGPPGRSSKIINGQRVYKLNDNDFTKK
jgi:hypothetical protein